MKKLAIALIGLLAILLVFGCTEKVSSCERLTGLDKDMCYDREAGLQKNPGLCNNISDSKYRDFCISVASGSGNKSSGTTNDNNAVDNGSAVQPQNVFPDNKVSIEIGLEQTLVKNSDYTLSVVICNRSSDLLQGEILTADENNLSSGRLSAIAQNLSFNASDCKTLNQTFTPVVSGEGIIKSTFTTGTKTYVATKKITVN